MTRLVAHNDAESPFFCLSWLALTGLPSRVRPHGCALTGAPLSRLAPPTGRRRIQTRHRSYNPAQNQRSSTEQTKTINDPWPAYKIFKVQGPSLRAFFDFLPESQKSTNIIRCRIHLRHPFSSDHFLTPVPSAHCLPEPSSPALHLLRKYQRICVFTCYMNRHVRYFC